VTAGAYAGWQALIVHNRSAEAVIVPAIGRVMGLGLAGAGPGPFWAHPRIGIALGPDENGWINYGGDKSWPAPQIDWERMTGHAWPPPRTFDAVPYEASVVGNRTQIRSAVDPAYGMRVRRTIALDAAEPVMTIETSYEKVSGAPVRVAVWTITQLGPPDRMFVLLPERSTFPKGHALRMPAAPRDLRVDGRLLSLARDPAQKTMIASDGDALLWVGEALDLLVERVTPPAGQPPPGTDTWPDGAHAQIYTSPDGDDAYVELELLGPLRQLGAGETAALTARYTLIRRRDADPLGEARRVFGVP